jgi:hypothetical protein
VPDLALGALSGTCRLRHGDDTGTSHAVDSETEVTKSAHIADAVIARSRTPSTSGTCRTPSAVGARRRLPLAGALTESSGSGVRAGAAPNGTTEQQPRITGDALAEAAPNSMSAVVNSGALVGCSARVVDFSTVDGAWHFSGRQATAHDQ